MTHDLLSFSSLYSVAFEHDDCMVYKIHKLTIKCFVFNLKQSQISHRKEKISKTGFYGNDLAHFGRGLQFFFFPLKLNE